MNTLCRIATGLSMSGDRLAGRPPALLTTVTPFGGRGADQCLR
jgi:hypothetical protein